MGPTRQPSSHPLSAVVPPKAPVKRHRLTLQDRLDVIKFCEENPHLTDGEAAWMLRRRGYLTITQPTVWRLKKQKDELEELAKNPNERRFKRVRRVEYPDVDQALRVWILQKLGGRGRLTGDIIRAKARHFAMLFGYSSDFLSLSGGWLSSLKARMGLKRYHFHGEAASAPINTLAAEIKRVRALIEEHQECDVFNFDESALYWMLVPDVGLATRQMAGVKGNKTRLSVGLCSNIDGSDKLPPLIIGRARRPRAFGKRDGRNLGFDYWWNKKAWMTGSIWQGWLANLEAEMARQKRHILLLCDNAPSHTHDPAKYPHIQVEFFAPNLTAWIQPNDAGIIRCWKSNYKRLLVQQAIEREDAGEENVYKINQLTAMSMIYDAWEQVAPRTIQNCWRHTKLYGPDPDPSSPTASVPTEADDVQDSLLALQATIDNLHRHAPSVTLASAADFAALDGAIPTEQEWTDEEIVDQVTAEIQHADADARGQMLYDDDMDDVGAGDTPNVATAAPSKPLSHTDALESIRALRNYVAGLNNPHLEANLSLLSHLNTQLSTL